MKVVHLLFGLLLLGAGTCLLVAGRSAAAGWAGVFLGISSVALSAWELYDKRFHRPRASARSRMRARPPHQLAARSSRVHDLACLLSTVGFVGSGAVMVWSGPYAVVGWITIAFSGLGLAVFFWQAVDPRPRLFVSELGVFDRTLGVGTIAWSDIDDWHVESVYCNHISICLLVREPGPSLRDRLRTHEAINGPNRNVGVAELCLRLGGLTVPAEEVLAAIRWHLEDRGPVS